MQPMQAQEPILSLQIDPDEYSYKFHNELGNHFLHGKKLPSEKWNDPRLSLLNPSYFKDKFVVDLGCNEGILSIPIALKYQPAKIHAIDIDEHLVERGKGHVRRLSQIVKRRYPKQLLEDFAKLPLYLQDQLKKRKCQDMFQIGPLFETQSKMMNQLSMQEKNIQGPSFPQNIEFFTENFLASSLRNRKYGCILCMNVTKWVHLSYGDEGVRRLFQCIKEMSDIGTILILQSQPWISYRKKLKMYPRYLRNYNKISLKPNKFQDHLQRLGFVVIEQIEDKSRIPSRKHIFLVFQKRKISHNY